MFPLEQNDSNRVKICQVYLCTILATVYTFKLNMSSILGQRLFFSPAVVFTVYTCFWTVCKCNISYITCPGIKCIDVHIHTHTCVRAWACLYVCILYIYGDTGLYSDSTERMCMCVSMNVCIYVCTHDVCLCMCVCMYASTRACAWMHVSMFVCTCLCTRICIRKC